jgi:hypothetical protein
MNLLPILLIGGAAALVLTKKKPSKAITNGNGKTNGDVEGPPEGEPAIGDTVASNTTPMNGILWKVVKSPDGYMGRWTHFTKEGDEAKAQWHSIGEFDTAAEAQQRIVDMIGLGQIP